MLLEYTKDGRIATFTLNRPEALNALDPQIMAEYNTALTDFRDDDNLWVGIVTGAGKAFCAGADIKTLSVMKNSIATPWRMASSTMRGFELWKPLIAAINGIAFGGGLELVLSCDIRVASEKAKFGLPEVKLGVIPGWGGPTRLPQTLPWAIASEMLMIGDPITAEQALRFGLVNKVVPPEEVMPAARKYAEAICQNGPLAVRMVKRIMLASRQLGLDDALRFEWDQVGYIMGTEDSAEGIRAFIENDKPTFKGK